MHHFADLLQSIPLTGGLFLEAEFSAPWCVTSQISPADCARFVPTPRSVIAFHYVYAGEMLLQLQEQPPLTIRAGEIAILPRNDEHSLGSTLQLTPVDAGGLIRPTVGGGLDRICHGGGGERTRLICGYLGSENPQQPLLKVLPAVMKLSMPVGATADWFDSSFRLAAQESSASLHHSPTTLVKLSEILFLDAVRRYLDQSPAEQGSWSAESADPNVIRALGLLQQRLQDRWTVNALAREVGMSRSVFAERFARAVGSSPKRYLAQQRLRVAAQRMRESSESIARIALAVGYDSEAAFNRAFKREFGEPPASWRRRSSQGSRRDEGVE